MRQRRCACAPCGRARAICRCAGDLAPAAAAGQRRGSVPLLGAVLKLLLERGKLGEWRIGIRLFVLTDAQAGFGVIEVALSPIDRIAAIAAARLGELAVAAGAVGALLALLLPFLLLLPLMPLLPLAALFAFAVLPDFAALSAWLLCGGRGSGKLGGLPCVLGGPSRLGGVWLSRAARRTSRMARLVV